MLLRLLTTKFAPLILGLLLATAPSRQDPVPPSDGDPTLPFRIIANASHHSINLQPINANNLTFWIGKPTTSSCPLANQTACPGPKDNHVTALITDGNYLVGITLYKPYVETSLTANRTARYRTSLPLQIYFMQLATAPLATQHRTRPISHREGSLGPSTRPLAIQQAASDASIFSNLRDLIL